MKQRLRFGFVFFGLAVFAVPGAMSATPSDVDNKIGELVASSYDSAQVVAGSVQVEETAKRPEARVQNSVRKREGMDSKEENDLEQFGLVQPPYAMPSLAKAMGVLENHDSLNSLPATPSPVPNQILTTVPSIDLPDTHGAVGRTQIVTAINAGLFITPRDQSSATTYVNWPSFWQSVLVPNATAHNIFDPRLLFDANNNRYILTLAYSTCTSAGCARDGALLIGASETENAAGGWRLFRIPLNDASLYWVDFPSAGQNRNQVVVSINSVMADNAPPSTPFRTQIVMVDKIGLYQSGGDLNLAVFSLDPFLDGGYFYPAADSDSTSSLPLMTVSGHLSGDTFTFHRIYRFPRFQQRNGTAHLSLGLSSFSSTLPNYSTLPRGDALLDFVGTPICAAGQSMVERNGSTWFTWPAGFARNGHSLTGFQWAEVVVDTGSVVQNGFVSGASTDRSFYCSSIAVNNLGDALIGASEGSPTSYLNAGYFLHQHEDAQGSLRQYRQFALGQSARPATPFLRLGDYSNTVVDPLNGKDFWTVQEHANAANRSALSWANVKLSGIDLETRFDAGCSSGSTCPLTIRNIGDDAAAANASVTFSLAPSDSKQTAPSSITLAPPAGWRCRFIVGTDLVCVKNEGFAVGESAVFSYSYSSSAASNLTVIAVSKTGDIDLGNNTVQRLLHATE